MPGFDEPFVASGSGHAGGTVPDPGATAGTANYLREDASWAVPPGTGGGGGGIDYVIVTDDATTIDATTITFVGATVSGTAPDAIVTIAGSAPSASVHALTTDTPLDGAVWTPLVFYVPAAGDYLVSAVADIQNLSGTDQQVAIQLRNGTTVVASGEQLVTNGSAASIPTTSAVVTMDGTDQLGLYGFVPFTGFSALVTTQQQASVAATVVIAVAL